MGSRGVLHAWEIGLLSHGKPGSAWLWLSFCGIFKVFPGQAGSVDLVASRDIQASEDLLLSYGNLDNDFLLLDYGQPLTSSPSFHCMPA